MVLHLHVLHFHALTFGPSFSGAAFSVHPLPLYPENSSGKFTTPDIPLRIISGQIPPRKILPGISPSNISDFSDNSPKMSDESFGTWIVRTAVVGLRVGKRPGEHPRGEMSGPPCRVTSACPRVAVRICATLLNRQIGTQTDRYTDRETVFDGLY